MASKEKRKRRNTENRPLCFAPSPVFCLSYDSNGQAAAVKYGTNYYYYVYNGQGDVIGLIDSSGTYQVQYVYDVWGKLYSTTGSMATTLGVLNPFRYRGYVYDEETKLYYLNSRYYDPETCRFISADDVEYLGAGGISGYNLYAYCGNNPVMHIDPTGKCTVAWSKGYQGPCPGQGKPGCMDNYPSVLADPTPRDVTKEVNEILHPTARQCSYDRILGPIKYYKFYTMVNHNEEWDIKRPDPWVETIGTPFPGQETQIVYNGEVMTPQGLGNYTYGYLGAAFGIPLQALYAGSYYAAGLPVDYNLLSHEIGEDWKYITQGYIAAKWEGAFGWY